MNTIDTIIVGVAGIVTGAAIVLGVVAARTKNTTDDKVAAWLTRIGAWLKRNRPKGGE